MANDEEFETVKKEMKGILGEFDDCVAIIDGFEVKI